MPAASGDAAGPAPTRSRLEPTTPLAASTLLALTLRLRALVSALLPEEVDEARITAPAPDGLISQPVVDAMLMAGGDLADAVPFAMLQARRMFETDAAQRSTTLNNLRMLACEVIARRAVSLIEYRFLAEVEQQHDAVAGGEEEPARGPTAFGREAAHLCLTKRFKMLDDDGDETLPTSAFEAAVDQDCVIFLSAPEAQRCAQALWAGHLIQQYGDDGRVSFVPYHNSENGGFLAHLDPARLAVPRNAYYASVVIHAGLLFVYTMSTLEFNGLDGWEVAFWILAAGYLFEDAVRWVKIRGLDNISFWVIVDILTDLFFVTSFVFRVAGWINHGDHRNELQLLSFQFLACAAPLLWMQLLKWGDCLQYLGVVNIVLLRMLRETASFFLLLFLTAVGFAQCLFALDAADGRRVEDSGSLVTNLMAQAVLGGADWESFMGDQFGKPFGLIVYYVYVFVSTLLLGNILVALLSSAYDSTVDDANDQFAAYFAEKVSGSIRAPDMFVYIPPFNLLEAFVIAPFEFVLSRPAYARLNRVVQTLLYWPFLIVIALYESRFDETMLRRIRLEMLEHVPALSGREGMAHIGGSVEDPDAKDGQLVLSRTPFAELVKRLPVKRASDDDNADKSAASDAPAPSADDLAQILQELRALRAEVAELKSARASA